MRQPTSPRLPWILAVLLAGACSAEGAVGHERGEHANPASEADGGTGSGAPGASSEDAGAPAPSLIGPLDGGASGACASGRCDFEGAPCATNDDCGADTWCDSGKCAPFGPDHRVTRECTREEFEQSELKKPVLKCKWDEGIAVLTTPVVGDLDGDERPEIAIVDGGGRLVVLRGHDCSVTFAKDAGLHNHSHLAFGDLDGDGAPEIVGLKEDNRVVVFDRDGNELAVSPTPAASGMPGYICSAPAIANVDALGVAEIVYAGSVLRYEGGALSFLFNTAAPQTGYGLISVAADVDLDGTVEVVTGTRIHDGITGADETPAAIAGLTAGYVAIADFDHTTPEPEVVLISSPGGSEGQILIYHPVTGATVFGPYGLGSFEGGAPTVADFDGDGEPEVGVAAHNSFLVFDHDCAATPTPTDCAGPGLRWQRDSLDLSGSTGSSVFDFNGDGRDEAVYRDECWLRVYDGVQGDILFAFSVTNGTCTDGVVVADVDPDGHADIVSSAYPAGGSMGDVCTTESTTGDPHQGQNTGVYVFTDADNRWMPSRSVWNQHAYHITNVEDDLSIPLVEPHNWESWNNYRVNVQGSVPNSVPAPDLTSRWYATADPRTDCKGLWVLVAEMCNRGTDVVYAGRKGTFYDGDPGAGGDAVCTVETTQSLGSGACEKVSCDWTDPPDREIQLVFVADADGNRAGDLEECFERNNAFEIRAQCPGPVQTPQ